MSYREWRPYVPVAQRRAAAKRELDKMRKKGLVARPIEVTGRNIATSFWGKGWCEHMESFNDFENRLPRGRTYVRNGSVCHLEIKPGKIEAMVSGSSLYNVSITVAPLARSKWLAVKSACTGRIGSLLDLLRGKLASGVMEVVCHRQTGLFPLPGEFKLSCDCPDWATMCKHVAAVLYGVGARLDHAPEQLFLLRGVDHEELVDVSAAVKEVTRTSSSRRRLAPTGIADVFGIELADGAEPAAGEPEKSAVPAKAARKPGRSAAGAPKPANTAKTKKAPGKSPVVAQAAASFPKRLTGALIRKWREFLGESRGEFAVRLGVSAACIAQWELKERQALSPRESSLAALKKVWAGSPLG